MSKDYQFMVDFTMPDVLSEDFMNLIPYQRAMVQRYFNEGKLLNYALSLENSKLWAIFSANSEMEVMDLLIDLPLTEYMKVEISMLTFYNTTNPAMPQFSKN
ncbi:MAG: muconolactone Delta-isomerase family protein [Bacteroidota bacterium]